MKTIKQLHDEEQAEAASKDPKMPAWPPATPPKKGWPKAIEPPPEDTSDGWKDTNPPPAP